MDPMPAAEPIDLADVRSYLQMEPDDTSCDPILTDSIAYCRDRLEAVLPYSLAERDMSATEAVGRGLLRSEMCMALRGPVLWVSAVTIRLRGGADAVAPEDSWYVFDDVLHLDLRSALADVEDAVPVGVVCEYRAGAHVPPVVKNALLMMVRNRYQRLDEDPLTDQIMRMIHSETRPNI